MSASYNNRGDLNGDPTNGAALSWDERNQLRTINSTAYSFLYDAFGRREAFDDLGVTETYLYDALQAMQTTNLLAGAHVIPGDFLSVRTSQTR